MTEKELRQKFVNMAMSYLGAKEGSSKHKNIINTYNKIVPLPSGYKVKYTDAWCATFVSAIASKVGMLDIIPAECSCNRQIELWKKMGRWEEKDSYVPKIADILYFDWDDSGKGDNTGSSDHVGIIVSISGTTMKVIEGNKNNAVEYRTMSVNGKFIRGYGKPDFASKATKKESVSAKESVCNVELKILRYGDEGADVKALQILLIGYGCSCGKSGADGDFGSGTLAAVKKFQGKKGLSQDGEVGEKTWAKLLGN